MSKQSSAIIAAVLLGCVLVVSAAVTTAQKNELLTAHNNARARMPAQTMPNMVWDDNLQTVAQNWADKCTNQHNDGRTTDYQATGGTAYSYVGENLAAAGATNAPPAMSAATNGWFGEEAYWTYPMTCQSGKVCGHWTQIIWANSIAIGCGIASCSNIFPGFQGTYVVCNYGPGGNYNGQAPYVQRTTPTTTTTPPVATPKAAPVAAPKASPVAAPRSTPVAAPRSTPVTAAPRTTTTPTTTSTPPTVGIPSTVGTPTSSISSPDEPSSSASAISSSILIALFAAAALLL